MSRNEGKENEKDLYDVVTFMSGNAVARLWI